MLPLQERNKEFSLPLLHHLLLQTNLDRTHSCQHEVKALANLPLMPYASNSLQKKVPFIPKSAPFRKHFSICWTRKGISFFGNTWALPLSGAFNIPFNRGVLHILSAHLPSETQDGTEITALAPTQTSVFIQHNSTLHRDTNLDPRINVAEFILPGLHH